MISKGCVLSSMATKNENSEMNMWIDDGVFQNNCLEIQYRMAIQHTPSTVCGVAVGIARRSVMSLGVSSSSDIPVRSTAQTVGIDCSDWWDVYFQRATRQAETSTIHPALFFCAEFFLSRARGGESGWGQSSGDLAISMRPDM